MAVKVAIYLELVPAETSDYDQMPEKVKVHFSLMSYCELIRPLVHHDRVVKGWSVRRIAICYGVTYYQTITILEKCK